MSIQEYLARLDAKLQELAGVIVDSSIQREMDANGGIRVRVLPVETGEGSGSSG